MRTRQTAKSHLQEWVRSRVSEEYRSSIYSWFGGYSIHDSYKRRHCLAYRILSTCVICSIDTVPIRSIPTIYCIFSIKSIYNTRVYFICKFALDRIGSLVDCPRVDVIGSRVGSIYIVPISRSRGKKYAFILFLLDKLFAYFLPRDFDFGIVYSTVVEIGFGDSVIL